MRACFVLRHRSWSGGARAFADAATLLAARGYETSFVAPEASEVARVLAFAGHDVVSVPIEGAWWRAAWHLRRVVAFKLSEVLFVHDDREHLMAAAAVRLAGRGAVVRRTAAGERLMLGREGRRAMRFAASGFVFAHGDDLKGSTPPPGALAAFVAEPGVVPGADVAADAGGPHLAIVVGLGRRAEAIVALRAVSLLASRIPALRVTIITPAAHRDAERLEAAALGVAARVTWVGHEVPWRAALQGAHVAWLLAGGDDAMFAALDAAAVGVPVIAEHGPVIGRVVRDGETGVLRRRLDEAEWASVIAATLADEPARTAMGSAARRAAVRWPLEAGAEGWTQVTEAARDRARWSA